MKPGRVSVAWLQRMFAGLWLHASHVNRVYLVLPVQKYRPEREVTGYLLRRDGFPEFREADRWREVAVRILASECDAQMLQGRVHFERSTCYHRYIADAYLHGAAGSARRNRVA